MPVKVHLVVTGQLERNLPALLAKVFSTADLEFVGVQYVESITSTRLPKTPTAGDLKGTELIGAMMAALDPGRHGITADFAIAIDDVELENAQNESAILAHIVDAARYSAIHGPCDAKGVPIHRGGAATIDVRRGSRVTRPLNTAVRRAQALRGRCSFHLLSPMIEGPFFADPAAIAAARPQPPMHRSLFNRNNCDPEAFLVDDAMYLAVPDDHIPAGHPMPIPWARPDRARHPKHYLQFLLDPRGTTRRAYRETKEGKDVLLAFDPATITTISGHLLRFHGLLHDLADMAGVHLPSAYGAAPARTSTVLRNL